MDCHVVDCVSVSKDDCKANSVAKHPGAAAPPVVRDGPHRHEGHHRGPPRMARVDPPTPACAAAAPAIQGPPMGPGIDRPPAHARVAERFDGRCAAAPHA